MSRDRLPVNPPPAGLTPPSPGGVPAALAPRSSPLHPARGAAPRRLTWSKTAVAWLGPPVALPPPTCWLVTTVCGGEAANNPVCTLDHSPASCAAPTLVPPGPPAPSSAVMAYTQP